MDRLEKNKIIAEKLKSPEGRKWLAVQMVKPLRKFRDYTSVARRAFVIDPLAQGMMPEYELDPEVTAWVIANEAGESRSIFNDDKIMVDLFTIASSPDIPITKMKRRQYDVETRIKQKANSYIFRKEDEKIFNLYDSITQNASGRYGNNIITTTAQDMSIDDISAGIGEIEKWGSIKASNIFMNPVNMKMIRKIGKDYFDPITSQEIFKSGYVGSVFGVDLHTSAMMPKDAIYITGESEYFGVMPVSFDLTVLPADTPKELKIGFSIFQEIGICVHNENALAKIKIA